MEKCAYCDDTGFIIDPRYTYFNKVCQRCKGNSKNMEVQEVRPKEGTFHKLLETMEELHNKKSHDYTSDDNPYGNYHFAGMLSKLFNNPDDAGFIGRLGEKLFRLANIENSGKLTMNESIEDTENDIAVIVMLWISSRKDKRNSL